MGKCYCDYCDVFLTHDSATVRRQHNDGNRHKQNVSEYYRQYIAQTTQEKIDTIVAQFETRVARGLVVPTFGISTVRGKAPSPAKEPSASADFPAAESSQAPSRNTGNAESEDEQHAPAKAHNGEDTATAKPTESDFESAGHPLQQARLTDPEDGTQQQRTASSAVVDSAEGNQSGNTDAERGNQSERVDVVDNDGGAEDTRDEQNGQPQPAAEANGKENGEEPVGVSRPADPVLPSREESDTGDGSDMDMDMDE